MPSTRLIDELLDERDLIENRAREGYGPEHMTTAYCPFDVC
jgi:hypothetical protein